MLLLAGCGGKDEQRAERLASGQQLFAQGQFVEARAEANGVLQEDPGNAAANDLLGQVTEKLQRPRAAIALYQKTLERDPDHGGARLRLGRILLSENALDPAAVQVEAILKREPTNAAALALRAAVHARRANLPQAVQDARAALQIDPNQTDAVVLLAQLAMRADDVPQAFSLLNDTLLRLPLNVALRGALADVYVQQGQTDQAIALLQENLRTAPLEFKQRLRLAELLAGAQRLDDAEAVLREGVAVQPENNEAHLAFVDFLARHRDLATAERLLVNYVAQKPDALDLRLGLARIYESDARRDRAGKIYREVMASDPSGFDGRIAQLRLARVLTQMGQHSEAESLLDQYLESRPRDVDALLLRAAMAMERGNYDRAVSDLRFALSIQAELATAWRLLALAQSAQGDITGAAESYARAVTVDPRDAETTLGYARLRMQQGDLDAAITILQDYLHGTPGQIAVAELLIEAFIKRAEWKNSMAVADAIKIAAPETGWGEYFSARILLARKNPAAGIAKLDAALQKNPQFVEALQKIVETYVAQRQPARAAQRIRKALKQLPQFAPAHNLLGEVSLVQKRYGDAETAFRRALVADPLYVPAIRNLASMRVRRDAPEDAIKIYRDGIEATQGDPRLIFGLATLYEQQGDLDQAIAQYENVLTRDAHFYAAHNNLAMLLVTYKPDAVRLARARTLADRLRVTDVPAFMDTIGWVYYQAADYEQSVLYLDRAARDLGTLAVVQYHLGMALAKKGDSDGARRALEKALRSKSEFPGADEARLTLNELKKS